MKLINLNAVRNGHRHFLAEVDRMQQEAAELAARHAVDHVQKHPEFKPRTGALQKATKGRVVKLRGGRIARITNNKQYANAIDAGARPHVIRPRKARLLRFRGRDGRIVFARRVNHPGNKPYKFAYNAADSAHRVMGDFLRRRMSEQARRF